MEEDGIISFVKDGDRGRVKEYSAAVVAEWADSEEGVLEGGHDFATASRQSWEEVVSVGGGVMMGPCSIGYCGDGGRWIDIGDRCIRGKVYVTGAGVKDGGG